MIKNMDETREQFLERIKANPYYPLSDDDRHRLAQIQADCSFSCGECFHPVCVKSGGQNNNNEI